MLCQEFGLYRHEANPLITPSDFPGAEAVFNCGQTVYRDKTILLLSVVLRHEPAPRIHVAESDDGIHFRIRPEPFITKSTMPPFDQTDNWPIDPRVTYVAEDEMYYIMRPGNSPSGCAALLGRTRDWETYEPIEVIALPSNRVPCLFPEKIGGMYVRLDRPYVLIDDPHNNPQRGHIWLSSSPDLIHWGRHRPLLAPWIHWNGTKIGPTPPIRTDDGWLVIIHGVGRSCAGFRYSLGAILLDLEDPTKIVGRANGPLLAPDRPYEFEGRVPNVVFACGAIADTGQDRLRVYYGGADTCIGLATGCISEIVDICKRGL